MIIKINHPAPLKFLNFHQVKNRTKRKTNPLAAARITTAVIIAQTIVQNILLIDSKGYRT